MLTNEHIPGDSLMAILFCFPFLPTYLFVLFLSKPLKFFASSTLDACGFRLCLHKKI